MATVSDIKILTSILNPFLPLYESVQDVVELENAEDGDDGTVETKMVKDMELSGVKHAERGDVKESVEQLTKAIDMAPNRASGYNNRAQALRLAGDIGGAERDLERAIELSRGRGVVASQAYCQRAVIRQLRGDKQPAMDDFEAAARLGNELARAMTVQLNPYAALCNQMLSQAMAQLQTGQTSE